MSADVLFASLEPAQVEEVLGGVRAERRDVYRGVVAATASRRKLRAVFLDKKPLPERHAWMAAELSRKANADLAAQVLQGWLFSCRRQMLIQFLDAVGAPHDGEGLIESLPPEPPRATIEAAVDALGAAYPAWQARLYLALFCEMDIAEWPALRDIVRQRFVPVPQP